MLIYIPYHVEPLSCVRFQIALAGISYPPNASASAPKEKVCTDASGVIPLPSSGSLTRCV